VIDYGMRIEVWRKKSLKEKSGCKKNGEKIKAKHFDRAGTSSRLFFICSDPSAFKLPPFLPFSR
jgi:hypothetical protein